MSKRPTPIGTTRSQPHHRDGDPPPVKSNRSKLVLLGVVSVIVAGLLLVVIFNIDRQPQPAQTDRPKDARVTELLPPELLTDDELAEARAPDSRDAALALYEGGWIELRDPKTGRIDQRYRCDRMDPEPQGRIFMLRPVVELYLANNRLMLLQGDSARMHRPGRALESGTMTGNVDIRLFDLGENETFDPDTDNLLLQVRTDDASYDNFQGEVVCPGWVDIQTATAHLPGTGLRLQFNEVEKRPEWLSLDRVGQIRLAAVGESQNAAPPPTEPDSQGGFAEDASAAAPSSTTERVASGATVPSVSEPRTEPKHVVSAAADERAGESQRSSSNGSSRNAAAAAAVTEPTFYRLTLQQDVRIQEGDGSAGWIMIGDELHIVFSMESEGLGDVLASAVSQSIHPARNRNLRADDGLARHVIATVPASTHAALASMAFASLNESTPAGLFKPQPDDIVITCRGGLTMVPLVNDAVKPSSADDARFEMAGRPVHLHNVDDNVDVYCATLRYQTQSQLLQLAGSSEYPLHIDSPEFRAHGERFWFNRLEHVGAFEGAGWMIAGQISSNAERDDLSDDLSMESPMAARAGDVRIAWLRRVDLEFESQPASSDDDEQHDASKLRAAMFDGEVDVLTDDFELDADKLDVQFAAIARGDGETRGNGDAPSQSSRRSIELVTAFGLVDAPVHARSRSDDSSIICDMLEVAFTQTSDGRTSPQVLTAVGNVEANDPGQQTMWSDRFVVAFRRVDQQTEANTDGDAAAASQRDRRTAEVDALLAEGNVQILTADGIRAFADRLEGNPHERMLVLTGERVTAISGNGVLDEGTRLELYEPAEGEVGGLAVWPSAGRFTMYTDNIAMPAFGPIERPIVDESINPRQMFATWTESMTYDGSVNHGAGEVHIVGDVRGESTPSAFEHNTMQGHEITLRFMHVADDDALSPAQERPADLHDDAAPGLLAAAGNGKRKLKELIALGDAKLENRTWLLPDRSDVPRLFYVAGQHITYDDETLNAAVLGAGDLLVRDERDDDIVDNAHANAPEADADANAHAQTSGNHPFGAKGVTHFRWSQRLDMIRQADALFHIDMRGGVQVIHRDLQQAISTMAGDRLEALVERTQAGEMRDASLDLGGAMELQQVRGIGSIVINSPTRDIVCDEFDYNYAEQTAMIIALPGRMVTVKTDATGEVVRAQTVRWNMAQDHITITNASGSGSGGGR